MKVITLLFLAFMLCAGGASAEVYPLVRNGIALHLECSDNGNMEENILLIHGSAYSSHEFDIQYQDYSLVSRLEREGYTVWRLDIAGYGQSGQVQDGFMPDTAYAAEDINAAVEKIVKISRKDKIDVLGWSWGTMTAGTFAAVHPEHLRKLVLYAPILTGLGKQEIKEPFAHNTWDSAAEDFQRNEDGTFDPGATDPVLIELFCSSCWHYDGDSSPNGWTKDAFVDEDSLLIDLSSIPVPVLLLYGDKDPYMSRELLDSCLEKLPDGSKVQMIEGGSHIMMYEKACYRAFQDEIVSFLR
ncbi:MAG: alpha/beta hydrolase [Clostridia bacterium]|nr:alpha/beta hydrolase [Clostridia bacterium]